MRKLNALRTVGVLSIAILAPLVLVGGTGSSSVLAAGQEGEALRIDVTLNEYSFSPEPLRIPAGRQVTLVIRNIGRVPHEFMAGREVADNDFRHDLFADLHVNIEQAEPGGADHGDHGDHDDHAEADEHGGGHDADAGHDAGTTRTPGTTMTPRRTRRPTRDMLMAKDTRTARWWRRPPARRSS